jgi:cell division protein ZapA
VSQSNSVTVRILDKEYQVACPKDQQAALVTSARYLDRQMKAIRGTGKVVGGERIAVMAALNISYELLQSNQQDGAGQPAALDSEEVQQLNSKLDRALNDLRQLEI